MTGLYRLRPEELRPFVRVRDFLEPTADDVADLGPEAQRLWSRIAAANGSATIETIEAALQAEPGIDAAWVAAQLLRHDGPAETNKTSRFKALSLRDLRARPKPAYIVDRLLQEDSLAVLEGTEGTFKSFAALAWAHSIALGRPWLGRAVRRGRVLYLLGEGSRGLPQRADAWQLVNLGHRADLDDELVFVVDEMPQLWRGDATEVLKANPGPFSYIVVDTLARALVGGNENLQQDMGALIAGCDELRRGYGGACVLAVHHLNAQGGLRGSSSLPGAVSTRLRLERQGATRAVVLQTKKQRDDEPEDPIALMARTVELGEVDQQGRAVTSLVLDLDLSHKPTVAPTRNVIKPSTAAAWSALLSLGGEANFAAWRDAAAQAKTSFKRSRDELLENGCVQHDQDGAWRLTEKGSKGPGGSIQGPVGSTGPSATEVGPEGPPPPLKGGGPGPSAPDPVKQDLPW